jgi:signal transduction histidine kinase
MVGFMRSRRTERFECVLPCPRGGNEGNVFKIAVILIFIPFLLFPLPGSPVDVEALEKQLHAPDISPKEKIRLLVQLSEFYQDSKPLKTVKYGKNALEILKKSSLNDPSLEIRVLLSLSRANQPIGRYDTALDYGHKAEITTLEIGDKRAAAIAYNNMGRIYHRLGYLDWSLDYARRALKSFSEMENKKGIAEAYKNIGNVYRTLRKSEEALEHYRKSLDILQALGDKKHLVPLFIYIGNVYHEARRYEKAMDYYQKSRAIVEKLNWRMAQAGVLYSIATLYADKGEDLARALDYGKKALDICKETGQKRNITILLCHMGKCHRKLKQYKKAFDYLDRALDIAIESKNKDITGNIYEELYHIYVETESYNKAYEYFDKVEDINDEILTKKRLISIPQLWLRLKTEKNEKEIQQLTFEYYIQESKLRRQELVRKLLIAAVLLGFMLVLSVVFYYRYRVKKGAARLLKESEKKLQAMNTAKDKLFSIIAHDLESPLNGLLLSSAYLEKNYDAMKEEEIKDSLHHIHENTSYMARLLENLLVWAVSQLGKLEVEPETLDLQRLTEETIELMISSAREKNIRLMSHINENTLVCADKRMVETIMRNLVTNAVKYSSSGGKVDISSRPNGNFIEIAVSDTGVGIPANTLDTLFQLGNHNSTRGTAGERGVGLGMFLCKEFVEKHRGTIRVESHSNKSSESHEPTPGTRVVFTLPSVYCRQGEAPGYH